MTLKLYANKVNLQPQIYRKSTFSGVYSNFESFLPSVYKFGTAYTLVYRCFRIWSNWTQLHTELTFLKRRFQKNGYPENFMDKCFKKFLSNIHVVKVGLSPSKKNCVICFIEISLKMMNNAFYFILKLFSFSRYLSFCQDFLVM